MDNFGRISFLLNSVKSSDEIAGGNEEMSGHASAGKEFTSFQAVEKHAIIIPIVKQNIHFLNLSFLVF
jgi:hypothetical protein